MERIVKLGFDEAIEVIKNTKKVMYCHGVWNSYEIKDTEYVIERINKSNYGADVYKTDEWFYVEIPSDSDMW